MRKAELTSEQIDFLKTRLMGAEQEVFVQRVTSKRLDGMALKPSSRAPDGVLAGLVIGASARGLREAEQALKTVAKFQHCGAKTRRGTPCQSRPEAGRDRGKFHGGESNRRRTQKRREEMDWREGELENL